MTRPNNQQHTCWDNFYSQSSNLKSYLLDIIGHLHYILSILANLPKSILEIGSGTGYHSCFLSYFGITTIALDINRGVIEIARRNKAQFRGKVDFVVASAFNLPFKDNCFDICFSQGLLEHFDNNLIYLFLDSSLRVGRSVILSVPSNHYPCKDFGDERLLTPNVWHSIITKCKRLYEDKTYLTDADYYLGLNVLGRSSSLHELIGPFHIIISITLKPSARISRKNHSGLN